MYLHVNYSNKNILHENLKIPVHYYKRHESTYPVKIRSKEFFRTFAPTAAAAARD